MDEKEKISLIKRNADEVLNEGEVSEILKKKNLKVYCGYEPSGEIHLGHLVTMTKLLDFQKAGIQPIVLLADWHAWLNKKGDWEFLNKQVKAWEKGMKAAGLTKAKFVKGTDFQRKPIIISFLPNGFGQIIDIIKNEKPHYHNIRFKLDSTLFKI